MGPPGAAETKAPRLREGSPGPPRAAADSSLQAARLPVGGERAADPGPV